jgi:hypothetical protein
VAAGPGDAVLTTGFCRLHASVDSVVRSLPAAPTGSSEQEGAQSMRLRGNLEKRLADLRPEVTRVRETLRVLAEQVAHAEEVAHEAATRALVASTPLADREQHGADEDLRRVRRAHDEAAARLASLLKEQDHLLDQLVARRP